MQKWTRDRVPLYWAMTRFNMSLASEALFKATGDRAHLDAALAAARDAVEVYAQAEAPYYLDGATRQLADIEALVARHSGSRSG